jgi:hypothetical protein
MTCSDGSFMKSLSSLTRYIWEGEKFERWRQGKRPSNSLGRGWSRNVDRHGDVWERSNETNWNLEKRDKDRMRRWWFFYFYASEMWFPVQPIYSSYLIISLILWSSSLYWLRQMLSSCLILNI